jgi:alpha-glucosidase
MKNLVLLIILIMPVAGRAQQQVASPDNNLVIRVAGGNALRIAATFKGTEVLSESGIGLDIAGVKPDWRVIGSKTIEKAEVITPVVREKRKVIRDHYRELTLRFRSSISLQVRVYNDGFAYRFVTAIRDSITVNHEIASYAIPKETMFYGSAVSKRKEVDVYHTSFEEPYEISTTDTISAEKLFFSPVLIRFSNGTKMVVTESDLEDYPGMFLKFPSARRMEGAYAGYPTAVKMMPGEFPQEVVTQRAPFIARTSGTRSFPWRVFLTVDDDRLLPSSDLVYRLASPSRVADTNWIKPGKGTDEWIIGINLFNVPFKAGLNTATYKFYIDFAKRFGFERIMMDAGWSDYTDLFRINPDIDMNEIASYARSQGVSLSMWTLASTLDRQLEPALKQFRKWGVDFIMTDFMDRDDQKMVSFYHRIARACAAEKIMVMFHGGFKPAGFGRTWPNAITREGVLGSEYNIWSSKAHPDHDLLLPFIRMTAGPMDYEPGFMDNATKATFRPISEKVMSMGTRMHQAAMFVVYESPIQLFSGNPSQGLLEPEYMELIGRIPTVWDETIVLDAKLGEYIVIARQKEDKWYVGGMTNWTGRSVEFDLSFLGEGEFHLTAGKDGINADRYPSDYTLETGTVRRTDKMKVTMAKGGGFVLELSK